MITEAVIRGINDDKRGFSVIKKLHPSQAVHTDALLERYAYTEAAIWLNTKYKGLWCYRYADLVDGVTVETPGVVVAHYKGKSFVDGVTDLNLIKDDGFNGQFQWISAGAGNFVPATVDTVDAERDARYAREREVLQAKLRREEAEAQAKLEADPLYAETQQLWAAYASQHGRNPETHIRFEEHIGRLEADGIALGRTLQETFEFLTPTFSGATTVNK